MRHGRKQGDPVRVGGRVVALAAAAAIAAALAAPAAALAEGATLWRLYNPYDGQHLLTTDRGEYDSLQPLGWRGEGEAWEAPAEGDPVYRLYNPYSGEHLYTGDAGEYASLPAIGWRQEGVAFRSQASGGDPVYRLFNPYEQVGTHLLTTSASEYESLAGAGWAQEGVAFRAAHAHTHTWANHTATRQVWVSNWVDVPDYETKTIYGGQLYTEQPDGTWLSNGETYWFYTDADFEAFKNLIVEKMKTEGYCGNYVNRTKTEKVQVGSHKEDHGSYSTETYVDYVYCSSCGARQ